MSKRQKNLSVSAEALKKAEELCEINGLKLTKLRKQVLKLIWKKPGYVKAYDLLDELKKIDPSAKPPTIYRTLDVLVKNKLIRKMDLGEGHNLYEFRIKDEHHDHMICEDTGKIIEFYNEDLENLQEKIAREHGYRVVRHIHQLFVKKI